MSEDNKRDRKTDEAEHRFGRHGLALFAAACVIIGYLAWQTGLFNFRSADDQLAAINAARAIPDAQNAGVAYSKLAEENLPLPIYLPSVDRNTMWSIREKSWLSKDYPQLAAWIEERRNLIPKLLEISRMEKCRLSILSDRQQESYFTNPVRQMGGWVSLLILSANMDAGEGRIDAAIEKYACLLRMGSHLRQQPVLSYYNHGVVIESQALIAIQELIKQTELTEMQLAAIESSLLPAKNHWKKDRKLLVKVERIFQQKLQRRPPPITHWRRYWNYWKTMSKPDDYRLDITHRSHLYTLTNRRRTYILTALKRFRNKTGHWPQNLDRIEPPLSREILTDPVNNKLFVYETTGEDFTLSDRGGD